MGYVACSLCGSQVSRVIEGEIKVQAFVKCSECFIQEAKIDRDVRIELKKEAGRIRRRVWGWFYGLVILAIVAILFFGKRHS